MPSIKRRHFIQSAGATLATIGLSQVDFLHQAQQFDRVNAQGAPRKLALIIGINAYAGHELYGCLNDVRSMQILLEHRYGFDPQDIKVLTDAQATRQGILSAFETHLIAQAKPGDIVVFHFSGHGHMVLDPDPNPGFTYNNKGVNGTIIPYDFDKGEPNNFRCLMGHTLFLLQSALKTDNVTFVLDSCHSGGGLRGSTIVRSLKVSKTNEIPVAPQEELAYQKTWLTKLGWTEAQFTQRRKQGIAKGIGLGAAKLDQEAQDKQFDGFASGVFTYLLTRYLWQLPIAQPLDTLFTNLELSTQLQVGDNQAQVPTYEARSDSAEKQPIFFTQAPYPAAEAVIHETPQPGQPIKFWLAGVSPSALNSYETGAIFNLIDAQGQTIGQLEQTDSRKGLEAVGKLRSGSVQPAKGMLLREQIRSLPPNPKLKVGLDPSLGNALPTMQTSLADTSWLEVAAIAPKKSIDYIIGRMTPENKKRLQAKSPDLPPSNAFTLFTADLTPIPDAFVAADEPVETAVARLRLRLKSLLVGKILRSILGDTSPLKVSADIFPVDEKNNPIGAPTRSLVSRGLQGATIKTQSVKTQPLKLGSSVGVRVKNSERTPLYVAAIVIADSGEIGVLFPFGTDAPEDASLVAGGATKAIPVPFQASGTPGSLELLLIMSREPLRNTLRALQTIAAARGVKGLQPGGLEPDEADQIVGSMLGDVDRISRATFVIPSSYKAIDAGKLAVLSAVFQVVEPRRCDTGNFRCGNSYHL